MSEKANDCRPIATTTCPDCGGIVVVHRCDGLAACSEPIAEALEAADAADELLYFRRERTGCPEP
jgi:hypothetical protein